MERIKNIVNKNQLKIAIILLRGFFGGKENNAKRFLSNKF